MESFFKSKMILIPYEEKTIIFFFQIEIVGTKDYRQPEWVTQMEEMRDALAGTPFNMNFIPILVIPS